MDEILESLKELDLSGFEDDEMIRRLTNWIFERLCADWDNRLEIITKLPAACQYVYACRLAVNEIANGGLLQFYFNSSGVFARLAERGFEDIGAYRLAELMRRANEIYTQSKAELDGYNDGTTEGYSGADEREFFAALDDAFYKECEFLQFEEICSRYMYRQPIFST